MSRPDASDAHPVSRWPATSAHGLGCAPLAGLFAPVTPEQAAATVAAAWSAGVRYFDTAPHYGVGLSEERLGAAVAGLPRDAYVVSTKVGRLLVPGRAEDDDGFHYAPDRPPERRRVVDFSRDGVRRSLEESLERLGLDHVDVLYLHDPDDHWQQAIDEAYPALAELRDAGVVRAIGVGMNQSEMPARFVRETDLDVVLLAGRYTLLDQSGAQLLDLAEERGVAVVAGGVLNSGVLADPRPGARFDYEPLKEGSLRTVAGQRLTGDAVLEQARQIAEVCERRGVPLLAAALQFPLRHRAVVAVVVGARSPEEVREHAALSTRPVPPDLWDELRTIGLLAGET